MSIATIIRAAFGSKPRPVVKPQEDPVYLQTFTDEAAAKARLNTFDAAVARQARKARMHELLKVEAGPVAPRRGLGVVR